MAPRMLALSDQLQPKALNVATVTEIRILLHGITRHPQPTAERRITHLSTAKSFPRSERCGLDGGSSLRVDKTSLAMPRCPRAFGCLLAHHDPLTSACGSAFPAHACRPTGAPDRDSPETRNREQGTDISLVRSERPASTVCPARLVFRRREVATNSLLGSSAAVGQKSTLA